MIEGAINHCDKAPNGGVTQPLLTGCQGDAPMGQMDTYVYRENNLPVDIVTPIPPTHPFLLYSTVFLAFASLLLF